MRRYKSCCFIGHREINITEELKISLQNLIEDLIESHNVRVFLFGSRSEFNNLCHSIVTELKEKYPNIKRVGYSCKHESCVLERDREELEKVYKKVVNKDVHMLGFEEEIEHKTKYTAGKASYIERNYAMIDDSDFCVFYFIEDYNPPIRQYSKRGIGSYQPKSGTRLAFQYAKRKKKTIINVIKN